MGYKAMGPGEIILGDIKKKGKKKHPVHSSGTLQCLHERGVLIIEGSMEGTEKYLVR